jgi:hypothetical protein
MWRHPFKQIRRSIDSGDSEGNPSVHSLSVTLGNHAFHDLQTYNWPCPVGHLPISEMTAEACTRGPAPCVQRVLSIFVLRTL